ncbi:hypothetical protein A4U53_004985 (plasmid) [Rhizobium ruizarguesonis]|uniref:Uncharacterized protein n=1 Tax=Rhizobium ruizarguesonis TaxID=2081791 RepID=A0ACD5EGT6_9HYPH
MTGSIENPGYLVRCIDVGNRPIGDPLDIWGRYLVARIFRLQEASKQDNGCQAMRHGVWAFGRHGQPRKSCCSANVALAAFRCKAREREKMPFGLDKLIT